MIEPKEITIDGKQFTLGKFPSMAGRDIVATYLSAPASDKGTYKLMNYVYVKAENGSDIALSTQQLIDRYTGNWETLIKLEKASIEYNTSFFQNGKISAFFGNFAQNLPVWISKILTDLLARLSQTEKQPISTSEII